MTMSKMLKFACSALLTVVLTGCDSELADRMDFLYCDSTSERTSCSATNSLGEASLQMEGYTDACSVSDTQITCGDVTCTLSAGGLTCHSLGGGETSAPCDTDMTNDSVSLKCTSAQNVKYEVLMVLSEEGKALMGLPTLPESNPASGNTSSSPMTCNVYDAAAICTLSAASGTVTAVMSMAGNASEECRFEGNDMICKGVTCTVVGDAFQCTSTAGWDADAFGAGVGPGTLPNFYMPSLDGVHLNLSADYDTDVAAMVPMERRLNGAQKEETFFV